MNDIIKTLDPTIKFSKFTPNIKIHEKFEKFISKFEEKLCSV